jgi:CheY-like chemotaxis protein/anti-sigma regulatory factor (Ser/Thr protein kinase)
VDIAPALPAASADPGRIRQIVSNLLTNAHLYTPEGGRIKIRVGASGDHVTLAIADSGRGMSRDQVERLFERFYRGDAGKSSGESGTGLGMSIVKSLVDLHEGTIDVESELGKGTTITVRLPRAPTAADLSEPRQAIRGKRVLVIDDEPEVARLIAEQLRPFEVDVVVAHSGEEAISRLRRQHFDAVTLDIFLGERDGFDILRELRDDAALRKMPIIVVSVLAGDEALHGEWSVSKPIDAEELTDAIGSAILAGRARVLVVGRASMREEVGEMLARRGIDFIWATSAAEAARLCEERRFEVALVDAGMRSPQAALTQLDLRGRRLRRSVVVFSTGDDSPGIARLDPDPMPVEDATQAIVDALRSSTGQ